MEEINILLLGCTGVGKSTFINSFINYLSYADFSYAKLLDQIVPIPTLMVITDKNRKSHTIKVGEDNSNEFLGIGNAHTQDVKTYVFTLEDNNMIIRLIDTPGMGDPRGIGHDEAHCENILSFIGNLQNLHAICFLFKPNETRDTIFFKYCINQIFTRLDKSACNNIIFCFTSTRATDYGPGDTKEILQKNVDEVRSKPPHAEIPCDRNIFCFDNESFKYIAGLKRGLQFSERSDLMYKESWEKSVESCFALINYITGDNKHPPLKPHNVRSTQAINEARRLVNRLARPLADTAQLIEDNIYLCARHKDNLSKDELSLEEMESQLHIPVTILEVIEMKDPATICTTAKCAEVTKVEEKNVWHYKQRCHDPCYLGEYVTAGMIGHPELIHCTAINRDNGMCKVCGCDFKVHMHIYYDTKKVTKQQIDTNMQKDIANKTNILVKKQKVLEELVTRKQELEEEHHIVIETSAKFAHFLQNNAITPFSDAYKEYVEYLINREKSLGQYADADTIRTLEKLMVEYDQLRKQFDEASKNSQGGADINPQDIRILMERLYNLKHNGQKIKEMYEAQENPIVRVFAKKEYRHKKKVFFSNLNPFKKENTTEGQNYAAITNAYQTDVNRPISLPLYHLTMPAENSSTSRSPLALPASSSGTGNSLQISKAVARRPKQQDDDKTSLVPK